jgi:hypothetical protein
MKGKIKTRKTKAGSFSGNLPPVKPSMPYYIWRASVVNKIKTKFPGHPEAEKELHRKWRGMNSVEKQVATTFILLLNKINFCLFVLF